MIRRISAAGVLSVLLMAAPALAADLVSLEWGGEFRLAVDSGVKPKTVSIVGGGNELSLEMALDTLVAGADGGKTEDSSNFSGEFIIRQPRKVSLPSVNMALRGHIIKTAGSTARLDVKIGGAEKVIEWKAEEIASESFVASMSVTLVDGFVPVPLPVSAAAYVSKQPGGGAVLVSLEAIEVKIGQVRVASFAH
jgi:hypothetical protein